MNASAILATLLTLAPLAAQNSSAQTTINRFGLGCQGNLGYLTNNVEIRATATAQYNSATGELQLLINNTTPIVAGEATATISEIHFNLPAGAVTGATLTNQVGSGGATPAFTLSFDADTASAPSSNSAGCLGDYNVTLATGPGSQGGIANPNATNISTPNPVTGPVTFTMQLTGPGTSGIDAEAIIATISQGGPTSTNVTMKFQGGGVGGQESGYVGSCDECRTALYTVGQTSVGSSFDLCVTGGYGCHACVWVSGSAGPSVVGGITIPIGLPIAAAYTLGNFGLGGTGNSVCVPVSVPNNTQLVGFEFHAVNITYNALNLQGYQFSDPFTVTIN